MAKSTEDFIEELSLLTVMLHESDESGFQMVLETCAAFKEALTSGDEHPKLVEALISVLESEKLPKPELLKLLNEFVAKAQHYLRAPDEVHFTPKTDSGDEGGWGDDLGEFFDKELVEEFVGKHTLALDDFESELLNAANAETGDNPELDGWVKGYLHNVKGEAGTVGLAGVAKVTHHVEDLVVKNSAVELLDQLFLYRAWLLDCMQAVSEGRAPKKLSQDFLTEIENESSEETSLPSEKEESAEQEKYKVEGDLEVLGEFIVEAEDHLNGVEEILLDCQGECDAEAVGALFRAIHSVKGGSSYFALQEITKSSHVTETLLDEVRDGRRTFNAALAELLLSYIDLQKVLFQAATKAMQGDGFITPSPKTEDYLKQLEQYKSSEATESSSTTASEEEVAEQIKDTEADNEISEPATETAAAKSEPSAAETLEKEQQSTKKTEKLNVKTFLKVDSDRLDQLIDYVGEMVISSSMLLGDCRSLLPENEAVMKNCHQLEQILREVQYLAMSMRLVPVKGVFQKMSRLVWDTSRKIGKKISCKLEGEDTELDRTVIDKIADPLMHMVRNSVDHGIEETEDREKTGKDPNGSIILRAYHLAGSVHIQVIDDGRGLDPEKIRNKALEKGIINPEQQLSKQEILQLIFAPGFSTAAVVTDISGRGVGMDVVRRNIEAMRGRVMIESEPGKGATFTIELPLTLAIIDGIETSLGKERFIIPTLSIVEFLKPKPEMITKAIGKGETLEFRGQFLPIFRLSRLYNIESKVEDLTQSIMVVVEASGEQIALMVDDVVGKHSTVIKGLGAMFREAQGLAGCAIMPDGYVGLILDIPSLLKFARSKDSMPAPASLPDQTAREQMLSADKNITVDN